jgi:spore maturation protein CgeB
VTPLTDAGNDGRGSLVIVGNDGGTNVGASLLRAARSCGLSAVLVDARRAFAAPKVVGRVNWWLRGRRPTRLGSFGREVAEVCRDRRPRWLLTTGLSPVDRRVIDAVNALGVETINYLTDDPWNPAFRSAWFLDALAGYRRVATVRRSNIGDLEAQTHAAIEYVPFGFDPEIFYPPPAGRPREQGGPAGVFFAGGADPDRVPYIHALLSAGIDVALYGDHWDRYSETRAAARGHLPPDALREHIWKAAVCLCLVRRANRDGHSMRTFEVPAAGGCMLVENTDEHREIFGEDGQAVRYFTGLDEEVAITKELLACPERRQSLAAASHRLVWDGGCTYEHRLRTLLKLTDVSKPLASRPLVLSSRGVGAGSTP